MFDRGSESYKTDIKLGEKYRDKITGFEGTAVVISFFQHACERVSLRTLNKDMEIVEQSFDAPELVHVATGRQPGTSRTGGVRPTPGRAQEPGRR
jgi:hypothetical protein